MASVLYGRLIGPVGFARPVAIKRLHPHIAREPAVVSMFIDEARICSRVSHANVVPILDVIETPGELSLVMEYVHGCTLEALLQLVRERGELIPLHIAGALILGVLHGLEAAHDAKSEQGEPLHIVHRDVSPQNIMLGVDGIPRLFDFGIAKARGRLRSTPSGEIKGKLAYMAPEQLSAGSMDARVDIYAASVVLWEILTGRMLFDGAHESSVVHAVMYDVVEGPKTLRRDVSDTLDALVLRGLARNPEERFASVREMARALERALVPGSQSEVSEWLDAFAGERLRARAEWLRELQRAAEQGWNAGTQTERLARDDHRVAQHDAAAFQPGGRHALHRYSFMRKKPSSWLLLLLAALATAIAIALWLPREERRPDSVRAAETPVPTTKSGATAPPKMPAAPANQAPNADDDWTGDSPEHGVEIRPAEAAPPSPPVDAPQPIETRPATNHQSKVRAPAREASKARDCREPFVIDALGVKRWKRQCL
jgi:serine/threonine-protein kinase